MINTAIENALPDNSCTISDVRSMVEHHYPNLLGSVYACMAVFGAMALKGRTKPLSLIFETASGYGKTATLQMVFPTPESGLKKFVYRSDKFTPKAFVSHAASVSTEDLSGIDLLPKLENKVLVTKELAPILRGREEELKENFSTLISVLDGKGFTSDSGMRGQRGYDKPLLFNWIGATTPLPASTHRLMAQLGTRLLFFEVPAVEPTEDELLAYAERNDAGTAEIECQDVVNRFLSEFFERHPIGSLAPDDLPISDERLRSLVRWAMLLVHGRAEVKFEKEPSSEWKPVAAGQAEGPFKVILYFKDLARGHALIHGRTEVTDPDVAFIAEVALSSLPGHLRPIVRELRRSGTADVPTCARLCQVSRTTVRKYFEEMAILGIAALSKGSPQSNEADSLAISDSYGWLRP
ncbi:MAG TPA: hypothetical protein VGN17_01015 [Bryobacteraceae bacterium]|jgi:hypothetical protein